jgi:hypothetical protein
MKKIILNFSFCITFCITIPDPGDTKNSKSNPIMKLPLINLNKNNNNKVAVKNGVSLEFKI